MIREADIRDLDKILALYENLQEPDILKESTNLRDTWSHIFESLNRHVIVCELEEQIVASCVCVMIPNPVRNMRLYAFMEHVVTYGEYRQQGCAIECLVYARQMAIEQNCYKMTFCMKAKEKSVTDFHYNLAYSHWEKTQFLHWLNIEEEHLARYIVETQYKYKRHLYETYEDFVADTIKALANVSVENMEVLCKDGKSAVDYVVNNYKDTEVLAYMIERGVSTNATVKNVGAKLKACYDKEDSSDVICHYLPAEEYMEKDRSDKGRLEEMYQALKEKAKRTCFHLDCGGSGLYKIEREAYDWNTYKNSKDVTEFHIFGGGEGYQHLTYTPGYGYTIINVEDRGYWYCACRGAADIEEDSDTIVLYDGEFDAVLQKLSRHLW